MVSNNCLNASNNVVQVVSATTSTYSSLTTNIPYDDTIPQNTEGDEVLTLAITPKYSTSLLEISFIAGAIQKAAGGKAIVALFKDSDADALAVRGLTAQTRPDVNFIHFMTSGTTSSITFKIRAGSSTGTGYFNGTSAARIYNTSIGTILQVVEYYQ